MIHIEHTGRTSSPHQSGSVGAESGPRQARWTAGLAAVAFLCTVFAAAPAHAVSCDDFDECTQNDMCQPDGECVGTPRPNGTACDDGNPCTQNDTCQGGQCVGGTKAANGTPCTMPGLEQCEAECFTIPFVNITQCVPTRAEECMDEDLCTFECFHRQTKRCEVVSTNNCNYRCATGQCDPETGQCQTTVGAACDDFNPCTSNDRCTEEGFCEGSAGSPVGTPTRTATGGAATRTPTLAQATPTRTATTVPTVTRTKTPRPTPLPGPCFGDCDKDGRVEIDELVSGVEMALGRLAATDCFDLNNDGHVMVDELISAIGAAVYGCVSGTPPPTTTPGARTPTPTPTPTPSPTATTSPGGSSVPQRAAGTIQATSTAFLAVPNAIAALLTSVSSIFGGAGGAGIFPDLPFNCPGGGGGTLSCDMQLFPPGPPTYTVVINACKVDGPGGVTLTINGRISALGEQGDFCGTVPDNMTINISNLTAQATGPDGSMTTATFTNLSGSLTLSGDDAQCSYNMFTLGITGTVGVEAKNAQGETVISTQATFHSGSTIEIAVEQYSAEGCAPVIYTVTINGGVSFVTPELEFDATFSDYQLRTDSTSGVNMVEVSGDITSGCLGGTVSLATTDPLRMPLDARCPTAGRVEANHSGITDVLTYDNGQLQVTFGADGHTETFPCHDPSLYDCPAG